MKRILLPLFLVANVAVVLFFVKRGGDGPVVFKQISKQAIFNLKDPEQIEDFLKHGLKVVSPHSDPQTLVRITGHHGPVSNLKIDSPGEVFIINPDGIMVGETAILDVQGAASDHDLAFSEVREARSIESSADSLEVKAHGNVYALAIKGGGVIRATPGKKPQGKSTFEFPNLKEAPVLKDD